jgi:hypothetical protein
MASYIVSVGGPRVTQVTMLWLLWLLSQQCSKITQSTLVSRDYLHPWWFARAVWALPNPD